MVGWRMFLVYSGAVVMICVVVLLVKLMRGY
jgi:hypothetical protein